MTWQVHLVSSHSSASSSDATVESKDRPENSLLLRFLWEKGTFESQEPFLSDSLWPPFPIPPPNRKSCQESLHGRRACFHLKFKSLFSCVERVLIKKNHLYETLWVLAMSGPQCVFWSFGLEMECLCTQSQTNLSSVIYISLYHC